jgi:hypothetical protein
MERDEVAVDLPNGILIFTFKSAGQAAGNYRQIQLEA